MGLIEDLLKEEEGLKLQVYDDATGKLIGPGTHVEGHPTIGFGRALDVEGISRDEALALLRNDIASVQLEVSKNFSWFKNLSEVRQAVIVSMIFNLGLHGFSEFTAVISAIDRSDFDLASVWMLNSKWAHEVGHRATELSMMMKTDLAPQVS